MVPALERELGIGASRVEVEQLLGKPDTIHGSTYVYYLGRESYAPSFCVYEITFEGDDKVAAMNWRRH